MSDWFDRILTRVGMPAGSLSRKGFLVTVAIEAFLVLCSIVNYLTVDGSLFNLNEALTSWVGALLFVVAAVVAYMAAAEDHQERRFWMSIAVISAVLAIETVAGVHHLIEKIGSLHNFVLIAYVIAGLIILALAFRWARWVQPPGPLLLLLAVVMFVVAQIAAAINSVGGDLPSIPNAILLIVEEWGEMIMASFVLAAALSVLDRRQRSTDDENASVAPASVGDGVAV